MNSVTEKAYLLKKDKIMLGPYSLQKLKEKDLKPSDLIWHDGLPDWTPAGNIKELQAKKITQRRSTLVLVIVKNIFKTLFSRSK